MTEKQKISQAANALNKVVKTFRTDTFPDVLTAAYIAGSGRPSSRWSLMNKTIMMINNTRDARGYRQWQKVDRHVKKGAKAFHIIKVRTVKIESTDRNGNKSEKIVPMGIVGIPVFRYEDTEGKPLVDYKPAKPLPLMEVAERWGVKVTYDETYNGEAGSFSESTNTIRLCTMDDPATFLHELVHKAHSKLEKLKGGQDPRQETIAELTACVLARMYGYDSYGSSWNYIAHYAEEKTPEAVGNACMRVLSTVQKILDLILTESNGMWEGMQIRSGSGAADAPGQTGM